MVLSVYFDKKTKDSRIKNLVYKPHHYTSNSSLHNKHYYYLFTLLEAFT